MTPARDYQSLYLRQHLATEGTLPRDLVDTWAADGRDVAVIRTAIATGHSIASALRLAPPCRDVVVLVSADGAQRVHCTVHRQHERRNRITVRHVGVLVDVVRGVGTGVLEGWRVAT